MTQGGDNEVSRLLERVAELEHRLGVVEDTEAIRRLQYQYGYYLDKCYYDHVVDLFAEEGARVIFLHGVFEGKEGVSRLYAGRFKKRFGDGPKYGHLLDHPQLQGVVHVAGDRQTATARFRSFMQAGTHESQPGTRQWWEGGIYENTYVRENGMWKIQVLNFRQVFQAQFDTGWARTPESYDGYITETYPDDPHGPDRIDGDWQLFPHTETVPFHYQHPITGKTVG